MHYMQKGQNTNRILQSQNIHWNMLLILVQRMPQSIYESISPEQIMTLYGVTISGYYEIEAKNELAAECIVADKITDGEFDFDIDVGKPIK